MYVCVGFWGEIFLYMGRHIRVKGRQIYFILFVYQKFGISILCSLGDFWASARCIVNGGPIEHFNHTGMMEEALWDNVFHGIINLSAFENSFFLYDMRVYLLEQLDSSPNSWSHSNNHLGEGEVDLTFEL